MPALPNESAQGAGGERRQIDRLQLGGDPAGDERHQARGLRRRNGFRQQTQREACQIGASFAVAQPVGDERAEIDLAQLRVDRSSFEKMQLDEFAELVGDAVLIALDDRGVRDRQSQRSAKQRHHRIPVRQSADGGGFRERRDEAEHGMHMQQRFRGDEHRKRARQHQRRQRLDPPQLGRPRGVAGGSRRRMWRERAWSSCRTRLHTRNDTQFPSLRAQRSNSACARRQEVAAVHAIASRLACAPRNDGRVAPQKEGPHKAGLRMISCQSIAIRRSWCRPWRNCPARSWHRRRRACRDIRWSTSPATSALRRAHGPYRTGSERLR